MKTPRCIKCMTEWSLPFHEPVDDQTPDMEADSGAIKDPNWVNPCMEIPSPNLMPQADSDVVHNPYHYKFFPDMEAIQIIRGALTPAEYRGYLKGCALKYRLRLGDKGGPEKVEEDLAKSNQYREFLREAVEVDAGGFCWWR